MIAGDSDNPKMRRIWEILKQVPDPEIPAISVVELGMIADASIEDEKVVIKMTPTFIACPAIEYIRNSIKNDLTNAGYTHVDVQIVYDPPWTTDRISPEGLKKLKDLGLALPKHMGCRPVELHDLSNVPCPYCDSTNTTLESPFGPTLCRAIHYCNDCLQSFEHFKPLSR